MVLAAVIIDWRNFPRSIDLCFCKVKVTPSILVVLTFFQFALLFLIWPAVTAFVESVDVKETFYLSFLNFGSLIPKLFV